MKFEDIEFKQMETSRGIQAILKFDPYELSIVKNEISYGNKYGYYEIAIFKNNKLVHLPGINNEDGIKGFLTEDEIETIIKKLKLISFATEKV